MPPLLHTPDQITERPLVALRVMLVPTAKLAEPVVPTGTFSPEGGGAGRPDRDAQAGRGRGDRLNDVRERRRPRSTPQNRPYVDGSKPANGVGASRRVGDYRMRSSDGKLRWVVRATGREKSACVRA